MLTENDQPGYTQAGLTCDTSDFDPEETSVNVEMGQEVLCTFTNKITPGSVEWLKVGEGSSGALVGSEWELEGPSGTKTPITSATSEFSVIGLEWSEYTLTETKAPAGYQLL